MHDDPKGTAARILERTLIDPDSMKNLNFGRPSDYLNWSFQIALGFKTTGFFVNKTQNGYKEGRRLFLKTSARYEGMNWYISDEAGSILFAKAIESKKRMFHYQMCNKSIFLKLWIPNRVDNIKLSII